ncbi:MAG: hypothetical protein ACK4WH_02710 [Phycisphaerales bacterium]
MLSWRAWLETIHHLALALWLGVIVAAGAFAAIVFPTMKSLEPALPGFAGYSGPHWRIAGGKLGQQIFLLTDIVQFACVVVTVATLLCLFVTLGASPQRRRPAAWFRTLGLSLAFASAAGQILIVGPQMNGALKNFWAAAGAGNAELAAIHQGAFDQLHPIASWLLAGSAVGLLAALTAGIWSLARPWAAGPSSGEPSEAPRYPEPALLKSRRA